MSFLRRLVSQLLPAEDIDLDERRDSVRLNFSCPVEVVAGQRSLEGEVLNLTFTGLCLRLPEALEADTELTLKRDEFGPAFNATVLWNKKKEQGYLVGVQGELDEEKLINSWLEPTLRQAGFEAEYVDEKRQLLRVPGRVPCTLSDSDGRSLGQGELLDLSKGGALLESQAPLEKDQELRFQAQGLGALPPLEGTAKVVSVSGNRTGLAFVHVHETRVRAYIKEMLTSE